MGKPKKFSRKKLLSLWEEYKKYCDEYTVEREIYIKKTGEFVKRTVKSPITYTIKGFCTYIGITRSAFYETYAGEHGYPDIVTRAREESENDARIKFETGQLSDKLAGLWMSKYGYGGKPTEPVTDDTGVKQFLSAMKPTEEQMAELWEDEQ